jgi:hypothetical protein
VWRQTLDEAMQPPDLPAPFLYRPFEAGTAAQTARPASRDDEADERAAPTQQQLIDESPRCLLRVRCTRCSAAHWLPAQQGKQFALWVGFTPKLHTAGCAHAAKTVLLQPSLRKVCEGYRLKAHSGGDPTAVEVAATVATSSSGHVSLALTLSPGAHAYVSEVRPLNE